MISNKWAKLIKSLHQKKYRKAEQLFFVEGEKAVLEVLASGWTVPALFATDVFIQQHAQAVKAAALLQPCNSDELVKVGTFISNDAALAVVEIPQWPEFSAGTASWTLVLDNINDPGNLGTIIRIADWYGIKHIISSPDTADCFNPKVVAAAKGSFLRVQLHYQPLAETLARTNMPVYGAYLGGENVHQLKLNQAGGYIVLGNEANGISNQVSQYISRKITIPAFGGAESLNVGIAAAVICDNLLRLSH
ncbi:MULTISPECIES: TrmH family RNA methyltransferase [unclassified Arsukibacterium]|uniref:TrmH family RNA methyltransferase n=1 Tax=unclassified Arsukibacterium TaxID=2635278 RepID=UPI000C3E2A6F|nr:MULTISPECIES: RNA methyltransferase [unclassified Arsukibacterium]MAA95846.1 RNA methyltransferase [Rheinheimera sp.]MBM33085.1 RNA methyltransferase [Rheinheimera sp.]HAW92031.1 RNA methyltransferase [Candidatus Azambacteria bacterium]|tara:strand:+ start:38229 stop:38975 length:747 start_codon:yes stop_codon:yes gene_type:complete